MKVTFYTEPNYMELSIPPDNLSVELRVGGGVAVLSWQETNELQQVLGLMCERIQDHIERTAQARIAEES